MKTNYKIQNGEEKVEVRKGIAQTEFKVLDWGYRHQQCVILFCCLTTAYSMRACMGVSLVAMTLNNDIGIIDANRNNPLFSNSNITDNDVDEVTRDAVEIDEDYYKIEGFTSALLLTRPYPKFKWSKKTQDTILASFFWGYMLLQIPAGQIAHRFGARYLLSSALFINSVMSICLPWAAFYGGWISVLLIRISQGLSQACILPGMHTLLGKWAPLKERSRLSAFAYGGQALGTVLGLPMAGFIASSSLGWPGIFRFYGVISGLIGGLIWWLSADSPAKHPKISDNERLYIENDLGVTDDSLKPRSVPWSKILTSRGMIAIAIAHIGQTWGQLTLYTEVPAFMDKVMGVNIKANGLLTALPFLVMWFTNFFFCWAADMLVVKNILSVTNTRKLANSLGSISAATGLIVLAFVPKNIYAVETVLVVICAFKISSHVGFHINHIDISPNFSGTMMSISNFTSNLVGSLAPLVAGFILTDVTSEHLWRKVFFVAAGLYFFTNLIYVIIGTADKAEWNDLTEQKSTEDSHEQKPMLEKPNVS